MAIAIDGVDAVATEDDILAFGAVERLRENVGRDEIAGDDGFGRYQCFQGAVVVGVGDDHQQLAVHLGRAGYKGWIKGASYGGPIRRSEGAAAAYACDIGLIPFIIVHDADETVGVGEGVDRREDKCFRRRRVGDQNCAHRGVVDVADGGQWRREGLLENAIQVLIERANAQPHANLGVARRECRASDQRDFTQYIDKNVGEDTTARVGFNLPDVGNGAGDGDEAGRIYRSERKYRPQSVVDVIGIGDAERADRDELVFGRR